MKNLILGAFLLCSFTLSAQQFVSASEAITILTNSERTALENFDEVNWDSESAFFAEKKYEVKSYHLALDFLKSGINNVEQVIRRTVFKIKGGGVTVNEYNSNTISDPDLQKIKTNLTNLLTN
jgi:hypothetical protein